MSKSNKKNKTKFLKIFWGTVAGLFLSVVLLFVLIANGMFGYMPTFEILENPRTDIATEVYASDGVLLTTFFLAENRNPVDYKDLPPHLINALIAREDHRFVKHAGIDGIGLIRVAVKTVLLRRSGEGGGSTITQQLAKQLFKRDDTVYRWKIARRAHMATIKFREWVIAVRLERQYTKQEIVTMYLNMVPFGYNAYGIKSATRTFFGKDVQQLTIEEGAMLIGMLQRPSYFNPVRHPERTTNRRNSVLNKMQEHKYLSKPAFDSIRHIPIVLNFERLDHHACTAAYFREFLRLTMTQRKPERDRFSSNQAYQESLTQWEENPLYGWVNKNSRPDGTPRNLYTDGLKIYTTIDSRMQRYAEEAMRQHMQLKQRQFFTEKRNRRNAPFEDISEDEINSIMTAAARGTERYRILRNRGLSHDDIIKSFHEPTNMSIFTWGGDRDTIMSPWDSIRHYKSYLRASVMSMNPNTGEVKAYVGGINYRHFKWDGVRVQKRQVGSTFKPLLYTLVFQDRRDLTPCHRVLNQTQTFVLDDGRTWSPRSSGRSEYFDRNMTLKWGLAASENNISAWLMKQVSPHALVDMAQKMGITSHMDPVPALCLGTPEITLSEMTAAFAVFPNGGTYIEPIFVTRIEDKNGNLIQRFTPHKEEAINENVAYLMTNMLQGVVNGGTGSRLRRAPYNMNHPIGGKTGTTQNHSDGWFIGITPDLVTGVWVGGEDRSVRFRSINLGQGAEMALPIFGLYMQKVYADRSINLSRGAFRRPMSFNIDLECRDEYLDSGIIYEE
jgi:penicillin-binding protein 1A